jgi:hypothetical protein
MAVLLSRVYTTVTWHWVYITVNLHHETVLEAGTVLITNRYVLYHGVSYPAGARDSSLLHSVQTGYNAHLASSTGSIFSAG